jgi:hypothetical protein
MSLTSLWRCGLVALAVAACSPALNWRETRVPDGDIVALFPCKPERMARELNLAETKVRMVLLSCGAAGATFALSHADMADPGKVHAALIELRRSAAANVGGTPQRLSALQVPGMTPNPLAERVVIIGRGSDGEPLHEQVGFFSRGARVYQATVYAPKLDGEAADTFFSGLKLPS